MPASHSLRVTPPRTRAVVQRRLMVAICLVIVTLVAAIGLVGALTVQTLSSRPSVASVIATPAPMQPDVGILHPRTLMVSAV